MISKSGLLAAVVAATAFGAGRHEEPPEAVTKTPLGSGNLRFTQGGKTVTWRLRRGELFVQGKTITAQLWYAPPADFDVVGQLLIVLVQSNKGVKIPALDVHHGPAGSAALHPKKTSCLVKMTDFGAASVKGSFACSGEWRSGVGVSAGTLEAAP